MHNDYDYDNDKKQDTTSIIETFQAGWMQYNHFLKICSSSKVKQWTQRNFKFKVTFLSFGNEVYTKPLFSWQSRKKHLYINLLLT